MSFMRFLVIAVLVLFTAVTAAVAQQRQALTRSVTIVSEPGAVVWIDDVRYGKTNSSGRLEINTVTAGVHKIRLRADSFKEKTQSLPVAARGDVKVAMQKTTDEAELAFQEAERLGAVDREKAIAAYRRAIKLRPSFPEAYLALARALSENGDHEEARTAIAAAKRLRPGYAEASAVDGRLFKEAGNEEKAITAFKRAISEGKGFQPEALTGLGLLYKERAEGAGGSGDLEQEKADYDEAAKYFKQALKQLSGSPDSPVVYQLLGLIYERQHRYSEAIALYEEFLKLFPDSSDASAVRSFIEQLRIQMNEPR